jgi:hypothetical protein
MSRIKFFAAPGVVGGALILALAISGCQTGASPGISGAPSVNLPSAIASVLPSGVGKANAIFKPAGGSTVSGGAVLSDLGGGQTAVTVGVVAIGFADPMPGIVFEGDCTSPPTLTAQSPPPSESAAASAEASAAASAEASASAGASAAASASAEPSVEATITLPAGQFALRDLSAGTSATTIQVPLADLLSTPHAIALYKSAVETTVVACGDITETLPSAAPASASTASEAPSAAASGSAEASAMTEPSGSASAAP